MAAAPAIELAGLTRRYGERVALQDVTLTLPAGATLVVFGPNGAGKSTLLRVLATLLRPHAGTVRVLGRSLPDEGWAVRGRIGLLGHAPLLYRDLSGRENLAFHARLHGVALERAWELLERVGLSARADDKVHTYSRGMVQRLAVCRAVLHDPEVLLLDEPRANLDPAAAELVEPLIGASSGRTRIVTSHDPAGGLAEADLALGLRAGRADLVAPARRDRRRAHRGAVPVRRTVGAVLRKELRLELRAPQAVPAMALFSVTTLVVFHFALQRGQVDGDLAAGVLWVTLLFAAMLGTSRLFVADHEEGGLDGFLLAPVDRTALLVAKALALLGFLAAVEVVAVPAFALLLLGPTPDAGAVASLVVVLLLADAGIAVVGTLVSALAVQTRSRDLLVPLLALPLLIPVVIAAAKATTPLFLAGGAEALPGRWLAILGLYDLVFGLLAYAVFDYLVED